LERLVLVGSFVPIVNRIILGGPPGSEGCSSDLTTRSV
jgi:hypothetical protein